MALPDRSVALFAGGAQNWRHGDRGIARYTVEQLRALLEFAPDAIESVVLNPAGPLTGNLTWLLNTQLLEWAAPERPVGRRGAEDTPLLYHMMSPFEEATPIDTLWPVWARQPGVATVATVFDLIPLIYSDHYLPHPRGRVEYRARAELYRHVDGVLAISQTTASDVVERLKIPAERVHLIDAGATDTFAGMYATKDEALSAVGGSLEQIRPGFLLYVGGFEFRKNIERLIAGFAALGIEQRRRHQLVIVCKLLDSERSHLQAVARDHGLSPDELVLTGYVTDVELGALYHGCELFVFPSLYEGSGLPILEAMSCGAPVVASSTSTGPELLGSREATFDPYDPGAIARLLATVVDDQMALERLRERSRERAKSYSWGHVAEKTVEAYDRVLAQRAPRRIAPRRARIALVSPWPPQRSGIADYNLHLVDELGKLVDVDVVVSRPVEEYPMPRESGTRLIHARDFLAADSIRQADRTVYCMGNSSFHGYVHDLLRRRPGTVLFHDVRLTGFYGWLSGQESPADPSGRLGEWMRAFYGGRLPEAVYESSPPSWQEQRRLGIFMTREIQQYALHCLVHSELSRQVLLLDRPAEDRPVPVDVVPFAFPRPRVADTPRVGAPSTSPLVVSLGYVSEVKAVDVVITAFAEFSRTRPAARLVIAGPMEPAELARWQRYAAERAPGASIELSGALEPKDWTRLIDEADLAVQLRLITNGESSAAVAECLSAGLPVIVSDIGWFGALPSPIALKVPVDVGPRQLAEVMQEALGDNARWRALSQSARQWAEDQSFERAARAYVEVLEI